MAYETWSDTRAAWRASFEALVARFRPAYLAELERFAETLRPLFASGALRGATDDDQDGLEALELLAAAHFGIQVHEEKNRFLEDDETTAKMILAVSPSGDEAYCDGQEIASFNAAYAVSWDVLAIARARAWYTPPSHECPNLSRTGWKSDPRLRSFAKAGRAA